MRVIKLGNRPRIGIERRVTGSPETGLIYHWHFIFWGYHICFLPKSAEYPVDPIALFGSLCRK